MKRYIFFSFFLTLLFLSTAPALRAAVPDGVSPGQPGVQSYDQLVAAIRQARAASQSRVEKAVDQERVREAWEIGKLIDEHVLQHKERAEYSDQTIVRLARDLGTSETELRFALQFARTYPIHWPADELSWSHYQTLLAVNDPEERKALTEKAVKEKWTRDQVREEVRKRKAAKQETLAPAPVKEIPLTAKPGKPGTYKTVKATEGPETGRVVIDLGFSNYYKTSRDLRFKAGDIIEVKPAAPEGSSPSDMIRLSPLNKSRGTSPESLLYTYRAWVVKVLDGDTIKVVVDLGFGVRSVQTLRFRGLDCPELVSSQGKEARAFVETILTPSTGIWIKTTKSDKYDRYLADVFVKDRDGKEIYLNSLLLEKGHAVRDTE